MPFHRLPRLIALLAVSLGAVAVHAQNLLYAEYKDALRAVVKVQNGYPYVNLNGKQVQAPTERFLLKPVEEFYPVFIAVRDLQANFSYMTLGSGASEVNHEFHFSANFESPYELEDVFFVLDMELTAGRRIFYYEVGRLTARDSKPIAVTLNVPGLLGDGHYQLHLFTRGFEVFNSSQPWAFREAALDRMVAKRVAGVKDSALAVLIGPPPEYPPALRKKHVKGEALLTVRVTERGVVLDPVVASTTDPAFGEAALAAVRQWRFLPQVVGGRPVGVKASLPFIFDPPG